MYWRFVKAHQCVLGLQKNRSLVSLYDRTGVCTIRTLIKNDQNDLRTGTRAEFRPFSEALMMNAKLRLEPPSCYISEKA